jgi:hypothetical protein
MTLVGAERLNALPAHGQTAVKLVNETSMAGELARARPEYRKNLVETSSGGEGSMSR